MKRFSSLAPLALVISCVGEVPPPAGRSAPALTAAQCDYFAADGRTRICHRTSSRVHPYTILNVSESACVSAHADHAGDYIAPANDLNCQGGGCLPQSAPCDATLPCCEGMTCRAGVCAADLTLNDIELLALPNGWDATGTCGAYKLFVYDSSGTLLNSGFGAGVNLPLTSGTYTFALRGSGYDLNGGSGGNSPAFSIQFRTSAGNVDASSDGLGAPVTLGGTTFEVTSFTAARDADLVSPCSAGADGLNDIVASATLRVTAP
jgi:hypothetical protein